MKKHKISAVICAAGKGERAGFGKNKLLVPLYGEPVLLHTLKKFYKSGIDEVIVTSSVFDYGEIKAVCKPFGYKVVTGGDTRTQSVKNALGEVSGDIVLIHDGARPFVSEKLIRNCIESVEKYGSGICAVKATDAAVYDGAGLDRDKLYLVQTPQGFFTEDIKKAYSLAGEKVYADDGAVYGEFIGKPHLIDGDGANVKLTYREDFLRGLPPSPCFGAAGGDVHGVNYPFQNVFVGFGIDVHAFGEGNSVTLAGVRIPCGNGLIAHSDGDVVIHALADALLSAAGLNDIGHYFPETDEKYLGADSGEMLKTVISLLRERGLKPFNVSISVQAEKPRLSKHIGKMKANLSALTGVPEERVAVAAGTCEGLGFVGDGLGICAYCNVLLTEEKYIKG